MSWLTPLGFLGLLGLVAWLIIFLIKPNYQKKIISTTYVWRRSLKYRKKRIPINKLRNLLMILCQILAIIVFSGGLAQPFIAAYKEDINEKIIILDASADMLASMNDGVETRFDRAIAEIHDLTDAVVDEKGRVTVILATHEPEFIVQRAGEEFRDSIHEKLSLLRDPNDYRCTYGVADIDGAMKLAESVLEENPKAEVVLYTGTTYTDPGNVTVVNVADINEWNCAILNAEAVVVENYYEFRIELASYGRDNAIDVYLDVYGVNDALETRNFNESILYTQEMGSVTLTFGNDITRSASDPNYILTDIYSYDYACIRIAHDDALYYDNTLYLYGGTKPELKIQYYSAMSNPFYSGVLRALRDTMDTQWDINLTEVRKDQDPAMEGFDVYIFEHEMPKVLPTDGLVILTNPDAVPSGAGFYLGNSLQANQEAFLTAGDENHPLMEGIDATNISITKLTSITNYSADFVPLLYCQDYPVMLASSGSGANVVIMAFSLNYSNLPLIKEFPTMILNMLNYYVPSTLDKFLYEVNDTVAFNARADKLEIEGPGTNLEVTEFPNTLYVTEPGVYTFSQTPVSGDNVVESVYVKIPAAESNIRLVEDELTNPYVEYVEEIQDRDLMYYLAWILIALLFCEWLLQLKEYF